MLVILIPAAPAAFAQDVSPPRLPPGAEQTTCSPSLNIDAPTAGATVSTSVLVRGWALDATRPDGSGIDQVNLYLDGDRGTGVPLGAAATGLFRPDVDTVYSRPSSQAGWSFVWNLGNTSPGPHMLYVNVQASCGSATMTLPLTVDAPLVAVDRPAPGASITEGQVLSISGWALDPSAATGSGIDAVHLYVDGEAGSGPALGAATIGLPRGDVAAAFGRPTATNAGFSLDARLVSVLPGPHTLYVYAHSPTRGWSYRTLPFTLAEAPVARPAVLAGRLFPSGATGFSVSFPQCAKAMPTVPYQVAIVGATGGRAFYENTCLASQFAWARAALSAPGLYMNLNAPSGRVAGRSMAGPAGACDTEDQSCQAYNFGYNAALHAVAYARSQGVTAPFWWLDIETENTWSDDKTLNARTIQGGIDGLRAQGLNVGIYSTTYQWSEIAGSFKPGLPAWVAGPANRAEAQRVCARNEGFGGGTVALAQYPNGQFSGEYAC